MLKKVSYQTKLFLCFALIIFLILTSCGYFFFHYNAKLIRANVEKTTMDTLNLVTSRLDASLQQMDNSLKVLHASESFRNLAFKIDNHGPENYFTQNPSVALTAKNLFSSALSTSENVCSLYYISENMDSVGSIITNNNTRLTPSKQSLRQYQSFQKALTSPLYQLYLPPHPSNWVAGDAQQVYSVIRPVRDSFHTYGFLEYSKYTSEIDDLLATENLPMVDQLLILDSNRQLSYTSEPDTGVLDDFYAKVNNQTASGFIYAGTKHLICYTVSELTGWTIIINRDISSYSQDSISLIKLIIIPYASAFLILLLFLYLLTKHLTMPLRTLQQNLSALETDKQITLDVGNDHNEITMLTLSIQDILNRIQRQNTMLTEARKRNLKAHFVAMESQLNPHFLYNTLSIISAYSIENGGVIIPKMCTTLSNLLRYSITYTNKPVSLADEISNIRNYLYIMKMRYEHKVTFTWDLSESLNKITVPKLILQPIVENCFQHGFKKSPPPWTIHIHAYESNGKWFVSITNNGAALTLEKYRQIYERFDQYKQYFDQNGDTPDEISHLGLGLENTIMRLYIFYKGKEHFMIQSDGNSTTIEIGGTIDE